MTKKEARWNLEYVILPQGVFSEQASEVVRGMLYTHEQFFINLYNLLNADDPDYVCPYKVSDFRMDAMLWGERAGVIRVSMPPAENAGEYVRVYIGHDDKFQRIKLYSVMIDENGDRCFMTWLDDSHLRKHGKISMTEAQESKQALDLYIQYLLSSDKESK